MSSLFADTYNMVAILEKSDAAEGFAQIIGFLSGSYIHYALTVNPHIYVLCIKHFWDTASVKRSDDVTRLQALVDRKKIVISEDVIREILQLDDAEGMKAAKKGKLNEEAQEVKDLKKHLEVVNDEDDDVFTEATPLTRKVPVVDYQIVLINNKPRFKIIKADETHQLYISFITLLKNFDREDLENLWGIVKERFSTSKPSNFSDECLLTTLKTMFEKPDRQDAILKSQRSVYGLALVKR
nr:hypothetical protein [Tanacetum cinerariifolium]